MNNLRIFVNGAMGLGLENIAFIDTGGSKKEIDDCIKKSGASKTCTINVGGVEYNRKNMLRMLKAVIDYDAVIFVGEMNSRLSNHLFEVIRKLDIPTVNSK